MFQQRSAPTHSNCFLTHIKKLSLILALVGGVGMQSAFSEPPHKPALGLSVNNVGTFWIVELYKDNHEKHQPITKLEICLSHAGVSGTHDWYKWTYGSAMVGSAELEGNEVSMFGFYPGRSSLTATWRLIGPGPLDGKGSIGAGTLIYGTINKQTYEQTLGQRPVHRHFNSIWRGTDKKCNLQIAQGAAKAVIDKLDKLLAD